MKNLSNTIQNTLINCLSERYLICAVRPIMESKLLNIQICTFLRYWKLRPCETVLCTLLCLILPTPSIGWPLHLVCLNIAGWSDYLVKPLKIRTECIYLELIQPMRFVWICLKFCSCSTYTKMFAVNPIYLLHIFVLCL